MNRKKKHIYVLGLVHSHDASACLLKDGVPVVAIQKERLTRIKHDGDSNLFYTDLKECVEYCLDAEKIAIKDVDLIVENSPGLLPFREKEKILNANLGYLDNRKIIQVSHHLAHGYCAYGSSRFDQCLALVVDRTGNFMPDLKYNFLLEGKKHEATLIETESFFEFSKGNFSVIRKNFINYAKHHAVIKSLGQFYSEISFYVFFSPHSDGKLMGLAPYGKKYFKMMEILKNSNLEFDWKWIKKAKDFKEKNKNKDFWKKCANLAFSAQSELEKALLHFSKWLYEKSNLSENFCYAGGVALNCAANRKIIDSSGFKNVFIAPPASDCGVSMGCAYYGYLSVLKKPKINIEYSDYLGKEYSDKEMLKALKKYNKHITFLKYSNICFETARLIEQGKIIGWFQGKSEFGPRALGNRSILCDPRDPKMKEKLNKKVKHRESFRPFAPSVMEERASDFFDMAYSPYMLINANVKKNKIKLIPAVVHVDGTARLQTVNEKQNEKFYILIKSFCNLTGIPILLNTSFNDAGEPIVESPEDAIIFFLNTEIVFLCIGDYLIKRLK